MRCPCDIGRSRARSASNTSSSRLRPTSPLGAARRLQPGVEAGGVREARLVDAEAQLGGDLRDRLRHAHAPEGERERERAAAVLERALPRHGGGPGHQLLGHRHHVAAVEVRGVELEHGELGVVHRRDPLVAEVAVDLVDPLEAADDQPLQVELGCDAQEEIHVERVVVRDERPRHGPAGDRLHHRGLDLDVAALVEEAAHRGDHRAAHHEDAAHLGVREQVEVALAVAGLDVGEPVPLLRRRQQRLREQRELADLDARARPCACASPSRRRPRSRRGPTRSKTRYASSPTTSWRT